MLLIAYILASVLTGIFLGWGNRKNNFILIFLLGFIFAPIVALFFIVEILVLSINFIAKITKKNERV